MDRHTLDTLATLAMRVRQDVVRMQQRGTNVASAMSAVDLLVGLYFSAMNIPSPEAPDRDRFILSKGHAVAALYATLAHKGFLDPCRLADYLTDGSPLTGHPGRDSVPGVEASTGSLGHGLPIATGLAWSARKEGRPSRVFALLGDGELQEGSVWEGAALASRLKLDNLVVIVDINGLQGYDRVETIMPLASFAGKWRAFGWATCEIDGHDHQQIDQAFRRCPLCPGRPTAILARTIKGKGVKEMEDQLGWHYFSVPSEKVEAFVRELEGEP